MTTSVPNISGNFPSGPDAAPLRGYPIRYINRPSIRSNAGSGAKTLETLEGDESLEAEKLRLEKYR